MSTMRFTFVCFVLWLYTVGAMAQEQRQQPSPEQIAEVMRAIQQGDSVDATKLLSSLLQDSPEWPEGYYWRGREYFRIGEIEKSVVDFDRFAVMEPAQAPRLWERGISYYYAGEFEKGAKQFEQYQTFDGNDVENSVWRYLCVAKLSGVDKARKTLLPIERDRRIPMMQIYNMYRGKKLPKEVLDAARAKPSLPTTSLDEKKIKQRSLEITNRQLFYAHLYLGLYFDAAGDRLQAREHIVQAAGKYRIDHYMGDVARIHATLLSEQGD